MRNKEQWIMKVLTRILLILFLGVVIFFGVGECVLTKENPTEQGECFLYEGEWERVFPDGSREKIVIPGNYEAERNKPFKIQTMLPQELDDIWFCMRASQQDMKVYVGGELRKEYNTKETRVFGENSASAYVFFEIRKRDAGKELTIEITSNSKYSGFLNELYMGDKYDIINSFMKECAAVLFVSFLMFILGIITVLIVFVLRFVYKKRVEIEYLGLGILVLSLNMIVESRVRQFFLPNSSVATHVGFMLTMLVPYPFIVYINKVQKSRYEKYFTIIQIGVMLNFILSTMLQLLNILDFSDSMVISYGLIVVMLVLMTVTIIIDIVKGMAKEYGDLIFGIIAMIIAAACDVYVTFFPGGPLYGGLPLSAGLVVLLFMAGSVTAKEMLAIEKEKQIAIVASEAKTTFLANMSHEIRTPINTIIGMNEMILRESNDENISEYAGNVRNAGRLLLGLINDILDFSKIDSGKIDILEGKYNLSKMLADVVKGIQFKATDKGLEFKKDIEESLPSVLNGDEIRIRQILNNLLSNAVKYTHRGKVTLSVTGMKNEEAFWLCIRVADTGMGIKPEDLNELFDSFRRLEEKRNRYVEGTGLGLNITKQLVELMGGKIEVESEYGVGSCFTVMIPQQVIDETPISDFKKVYSTDNVVKERENTGLYAPTAKILVVDDKDMNLKVVSMLLKRTGINLTMAHSGMECLQLCRAQRYDVILMDHMMPELDGIETLHLLRKDSHSMNRDTVVIVLTANAISGMEEKYIEEGFSDYLSKPIVAERLENTIAKYLVKENTEEKEPIEKDAIEKEPIEENLFKIDKQVAMFYCMNDEEAYREMREEYCKQGEETLEQLDLFLKEKDWKNYKIHVHSIKSTSLVVGAVAFSERAKEMEKAAADENEQMLLAEGEKFFQEYKHMLELVKLY